MSALSLSSQTISFRVPRDRTLSLADYGKSLPHPPVGCFWERQDDRTWDLKKFSKESSAEPEAVTFKTHVNLTHLVMPHDTLQGLCLRYRVNATELKRFNMISGNNIQVLREVKIPISHGQPVLIQAEDADVTLQRFKNSTGESKEEALIYLEDHNWQLEAALLAWRADEAWQRAAGPAIAASIIQDITLTPEEVMLEKAQRQLPEHTVVFPTRIVFVDTDPSSPSSPTHPTVVVPHLVRSEPPEMGARAPVQSAPPQSKRIDIGGEREVYAPLLSSPYHDHDEL